MNHLMMFILFGLLSLSSYSAFAGVLKVCPDCPINSVTKAIKQANSGDTILVKAGIYKEHNILIDKNLKVFGEHNTIIDIQSKGYGFLIKHDRVHLRGLTIKNIKTSYVEDHAGIKIVQANHCRIEGNKLLNTYFGIYVSKSNGVKIIRNTIEGIGKTESTSGNGIHLWYCKNSLVRRNTIHGHRDGIYFEFVENSLIEHNISTNQIRYGLHFMFSSNNRYEYNVFAKNGAGVAVMYSKHIYMYHNDFSENWSQISNGLLLKDITDSKIYRNNFDKNTMGIYAEGTNRVLIKNNNFRNNGWAIKILGNCENNEFVYNNFISNTFEVVTNSHSNYNLFENNYWSDYSGYDLNRDRIGDVPHSPIKLFSYVTEQVPASMILLRSSFVDVLNLAEKITPVITPESYRDLKPRMKAIQW